MKSRKTFYIITTVSVIVVLSTLLYCIGSHHSNSIHEETTNIIKDFSPTEKEKSVLEQNYISNKIEETLNGFDFESEEERHHYREILLEHLQD